MRNVKQGKFYCSQLVTFGWVIFNFFLILSLLIQPGQIYCLVMSSFFSKFLGSLLRSGFYTDIAFRGQSEGRIVKFIWSLHGLSCLFNASCACLNSSTSLQLYTESESLENIITCLQLLWCSDSRNWIVAA